MKYSKGDTIKRGDKLKFWDGTVGIVLNDGMMGQEFVVKYHGKVVRYYDITQGKVLETRVIGEYSHSRIIDPGKELVYYNVLRGDQEIWVVDTQINRPAIEKL